MIVRCGGESGRVGRRLVVGSALLAGCSPVSVLNAVAPDRLFASAVRYGDGPRHLLDVYRPVGFGPFPVVVFVYGGDWRTGRRSMYRFVGGALAAAGFVTVIADYRLWPEVRYPAILDDCAAAVAWTRHEIGRFGGEGAPFLVGHSAGAYNVTMLALDPRWLGAVGLSNLTEVRGTVGLAGPYDFLPLDSDMLRDLFSPAHPLADSQPIAHADGRNAPMLLLAGGADRTVQPSNTVRLATRIRGQGGPVEDRIYPGVDHVRIIAAFAAELRFLASSFGDTVGFLRRHAGLGSRAPAG